MPDVGTPLPRSAHPVSHTSTEQWQSFEIRMRYRRAERCVVRAEAALEAGMEEEARAALAEARTLNSVAPDLESLRATVQTRRQIALREARRSRTRRVIGAGAIVAALLVAVTLMWQPRGTKATSDVPVAASAAPLVSVPDRPARTNTSLASQPSPAPQPPPTPAETSVRESVVPTSGATTDSRDPRARLSDAAAGNVMTPSTPTTAPASTEPSLPSVEAVNASLNLVKPPTVDTSSVHSPPSAASGADPLVKDLPTASLPVASAPPPVTERPAPAVSEEPKVRAVLAQFESAYSSLSAAAARAVWPSVDERSLARAFDSLESQQVSLGTCSISLNGASAFAECNGNTSWTPKIGGGRRRESRLWQFDLASDNGAWYIVRATAR